MTIVTNQPLADMVGDWGGAGVVLQDKIPDLQFAKQAKLDADFSLLFVCTYSDDEPVAEVLSAAEILGEEFHIYVSGKVSKFNSHFAAQVSVPTNVKLTDFLPEEEYQALLSSVDATIVLTTRENLLTCGAYESIAVGKPIVLSDSEALREYFSNGVAYTDNSAASIAKCARHIRHDYSTYQSDIIALRKRIDHDWGRRFSMLNEQIEKEANTRLSVG